MIEIDHMNIFSTQGQAIPHGLLGSPRQMSQCTGNVTVLNLWCMKLLTDKSKNMYKSKTLRVT